MRWIARYVGEQNRKEHEEKVQQDKKEQDDVLRLVKATYGNQGKYYNLEPELEKSRNWYSIGIPITLHNGRPHDVAITAYSLQVSWDEQVIQHVQWDRRFPVASNGLIGQPTNSGGIVKGDEEAIIFVPFAVNQVLFMPNESPRWSLEGQVVVECGTATRSVVVEPVPRQFCISKDEWSNLYLRCVESRGGERGNSGKKQGNNILD